MKDEVENVVATEGYGNTSEFFRDLVRNYLKERQERKLEALILEGINSGEATPLTKDDFQRIKERGIKRIQERAKKWVFKQSKSRKPNAILKSVLFISAKIISILPCIFLVAIEDGIELIGKTSFIGNPREFKDSKAKNNRMTLVKDFHNYQIYYPVGDGIIEILRVLYEARDLSDIFN